MRGIGFVLLAAFWLLAPCAEATEAPSPSPEDLGAYFDGLIGPALRQGAVAGGEIVVVQGGKLVFAKGYGVADVASQRPVAPDTTLFRAGSVSKLFTWTAVMQLVEAGKLDLDADVNQYLDFQIPPAFDRPITLRNLLTHTAGFEEIVEGLIEYEPARLRPLGAVVKSNIPARIFPPGKVVAYSNYGAILAGYIVERVSGEPYAEYIAHHIFQPLGMAQSSFVQPLPAALLAQLSSGYRSSDDPPEQFELIGQSPAGALSTTAADMARFMLAHLAEGAGILKPETARLMHAHQRDEALGLNGLALGFYEESRNGQRVIGHGGDTQFFHTDLHLLPESGIGLYVAFNSRGKDNAVYGLRTQVFEGFMARYFPVPAEPAAAPASAAGDAEAVAGSYITSLRQESSLFRIFGLLGAASVSAEADGTIRVSSLTGLDGQPYRLQEVAPLRYRDPSGQLLLAFVRGADGRVDHAAWSGDPTFVLQPAPAGEAGWVLPAFGGALLVVFLAVASWLVGWLIRRRYGAVLTLDRRSLVLRRLARGGALVWLVAFGGWIGLLIGIQSNIAILSDRLLPWLFGLYGLTALGLVGSGIIVIAAARGWFSPGRGVFGRLGDSLLALAAGYLAWFALAFNLVSFAARF